MASGGELDGPPVVHHGAAALGGDVPEAVAVQAAIDTLARWMRAGRTLMCSPTCDDPDHPADHLDRPGWWTMPEATPGLPVLPAETSPSPAPDEGGTQDPASIRAWARERGFRVAGRGRLPAAVVTAYVEAHRED